MVLEAQALQAVVLGLPVLLEAIHGLAITSLVLAVLPEVVVVTAAVQALEETPGQDCIRGVLGDKVVRRQATPELSVR